MILHKFAVGQIVDFDMKSQPMPKPTGPYAVLRQLPADDVKSRTYRIKSDAEAFERNVKEYEIVAAPSLAG